MIEEWKPVVGYEGRFEVSSTGGVRSLPRGTVDSLGRSRPFPGVTLSASPDSSGYPMVQLAAGPKRDMRRVHTLVLEAFVGLAPFAGAEVRHLDDEKNNNCVENLTWGTRRENMLDRSRNGRCVNKNKTHCKRGHEFNSENSSTGANGRSCNVCRRFLGEWKSMIKLWADSDVT